MSATLCSDCGKLTDRRDSDGRALCGTCAPKCECFTIGCYCGNPVLSTAADRICAQCRRGDHWDGR